MTRTWPWILAAAATASAASAWPLLVYSATLAVFGLPHVLTELRYVDQRFGVRLGGRVAAGLAGLLGAVVAIRVAPWFGFGFAPWGTVELLLVAGLVACVMPTLARGGRPWAAASGLFAILAVVAGAACAPATTLVVLAGLHNLTPVGFLAERLRGAARRRALWLCALGFVAVPALIVSGAPAAAVESLGVASSAWSMPGAGSLQQHLHVYVPSGWVDGAFAADLFRAAVFLQCAHYAVVLHVLPRLGGGAARAGARLRWPDPAFFRAAVAGLAAVLFVGFVASFGEARAAYGVFAAVHAWVELPILLLALGATPALGRVAGATA